MTPTKTIRWLRRSAEALLFVLAVNLVLDFDPVDKQRTLSIGAPFEFTSQDLSRHGYVFSKMQVVESLISVAPDGVMLPALATDWQADETGLRWRFKLRDNVFFHDGSVMDVDAVVESLRQASSKPGPMSLVPLDEILAVDDQVEITLHQRYRPLLSVLAHYSTGIVKSADNLDGASISLIGTGAYRLTSFQPPHKLDTQRFEQYWGQKASIERARYLTGHRAESRALQAKAFDADLIYTLDPASQALLSDAQGLSLHAEPLPRTILIKLNNQHPILGHHDIRRAISLAIDRQNLADYVVRAPGSEAYQLFSSALKGWHLPNHAHQGRDLDKARQLLAQQGWQTGDDGVLVRDGERFRTRIVTYADRPELTVIATAIQAQLSEIGIELNVEVVNSGAIPAAHHDGTLEMALVARNMGWLFDPLSLMLEDNASHHGSDWGHMNWSSPELSALLEQMTQAIDDESYYQMASEVAMLLAEQMPQIPVLFSTQYISVNQRVSSFRFDPFETNYYLNQMSFLSHD
ncbi:ABC transporter substrate-binding protein [Vibrio sp. WXL210]|uniref:ABC transporter substrate-binding protein n=1 Tax=Vibrio sp. WXL210 TaxID=3450709 RepID=UPI003EC5E848